MTKDEFHRTDINDMFMAVLSFADDQKKMKDFIAPIKVKLKAR